MPLSLYSYQKLSA